MGILFIGEGALNSLLITLIALVFELISKVFGLFVVLANVDTLDSSFYAQLVRNFYIILTVVMLFAIAFGLLKSMVNPDDSKGTGEAGNIFKKLVTSIVILALLPTIFNFAFGLQNAIISQNTIGKLFGNNYASTTTEGSIKEQGNRMANAVFTAFFVPTENVCKDDEKISDCQEKVTAKTSVFGTTTLAETISRVNGTGNFASYSDFGDNVADGEISFNFLALLFGGLFFAYVVLSFCFDLGVRAVKLVFYQIIAPIPVLLRITPQEKLSGTFNTWVKIVVSCYLEVFIRLFVLYLGVYLASAFTTGNAFGNTFDDATGATWLLAKAILILSIVVFIKESPKLIGELFGIDSSGMKLGLRDKLAAGGLFTAGAALGAAGTMMARGAVGAAKNIKDMGRGNRSARKVAGAIGGGFKSAVAGGFSGFARGLWAGRNAKSYADMKNTTNSATDTIENKRKKAEVYKSTHGGTALGVAKGKVMDTIGTVSAWSGWSAVDEGEANRYSDAANAFDAAHTQAEGVYKNKPGHNKLKEITAEKDSVVKRIKANLAELNNAQYKESTLQAKISDLTNRENSLQTQLNNNRANMSQEQIDELDSQIRSIQSEITSKQSDLSDVQNLINNRQTLETQYNAELSVAQKELDVAKLEQSQHEAGEMKKKISVVMEATNDLVNAKTKYADLENEIFKDSTFDAFLDSATSQAERTATENLINKIKNNELIDVPDISGVNINGLEQFLDRIGINAKNIASKKRAAVGHANALEDAKKEGK